jgi:hypothetical protein
VCCVRCHDAYCDVGGVHLCKVVGVFSCDVMVHVTVEEITRWRLRKDADGARVCLLAPCCHRIFGRGLCEKSDFFQSRVWAPGPLKRDDCYAKILVARVSACAMT